jgi:multidrug resistance efflux pump
MINADGSVKKKKRMIRWLMLIILIVVMFIPYPFEVGGGFNFLPAESVDIYSQVSGEVKEVLVREGDHVKKGQVIALLDTREHQMNYDVVNADLDKARAELRLLQAGAKAEEIDKARQQVKSAKKRSEYSNLEADRLKSLHESGVTPEEEYFDAAKVSDIDEENLKITEANLKLVESGARKEEIDAQKAVVRDLETRLKYYKENIELSRITSPVSGQVITSYIEQKIGKVLQKGELFASLQDTDNIRAEIRLPESDISEVKSGADVRIKLWAYPSTYFYGKVVSIAPAAEESVEGRIIRVITEFENQDNVLKADMTGEAKINGGKKMFIVAYTRAIVRFFLVEVWSWFP